MPYLRRNVLGALASLAVTASGCSELRTPGGQSSSAESEADVLLQNFAGATVTGRIEAHAIETEAEVLRSGFTLKDGEQKPFQNPITEENVSVEVTVEVETGPRSTFRWNAPIGDDTILSITLHEDEIRFKQIME